MLEIIAVTPEEARLAEQGGAGRVELVSALSEGGLTPCFGLIKRTVAALRRGQTADGRLAPERLAGLVDILTGLGVRTVF